jgi:hypothetical protein
MPTPNTYQVGTKIRLSAAFTDIDEVAQDPGGVQFKIRAPGGTITTYVYGTNVELVKDDVGNYHVDWLIAAAGRYLYRFAGVTSGQAADEGEFRAKNSGLD